MLLYNGVRISEFLDLKMENVHLDEQYFDVISSKTENRIRNVTIADKVLPFYKACLKIIRNASILSIHRMVNTSNTEIIMTATSIY